ncbi:MAG: hypothetical protein ACYCQI_12855 [Gammaproteobacteria bacterium]
MRSHPNSTIKFLKDPRLQGESKSIVLSRVMSFLDDKDIASLNSIRPLRGDISQQHPLPTDITYPPKYYKNTPKKVYEELTDCCHANMTKCNPGAYCHDMYVGLCCDVKAFGVNDPNRTTGLLHEVITCYDCKNDGCTFSNCCRGCFNAASVVVCCPCYCPPLSCTVLSCWAAAISSICGLAKDAQYSRQIANQEANREREPGIELKQFSIYAQKIRSEKTATSPKEEAMDDKKDSCQVSQTPMITATSAL